MSMFSTARTNNNVLFFSERRNPCKEGEALCATSHECVSEEKFCDGRIDCGDGSDERYCSCTSRLAPHKICDGYPDCPAGSDEHACYGCNTFSYSCLNSIEEYRNADKSKKTCFTPIERCDGIEQCPTGKDEEDCSFLVSHPADPRSYLVPGSVGFMYRMDKGSYYPVCHMNSNWKVDACTAGTAERVRSDQISVTFREPLQSNQPFISWQPESNEVKFSRTCELPPPQIGMPRIECPETTCGLSRIHNPELFHNRRRQGREDEMVGIIRGLRAEAEEYPFIVALYVDGTFECGGNILNENWVSKY